MSYKFIVLGGALLLQIHQFFRCAQKRGKKLQLLHRILQIIPLTPSQILQKIIQSGSPQIVTIVKGTVTASEPTTSILQPIKKILYSKLYGSELRLGPAPKKSLLRTKEPSYLKVCDNNTSINLYECHKSIIITTAKQNLPQSNTFLQKFKNKLKLMFTQESQPGFTDLNFEQLYLPDPSQLSILGKFKKEGSSLFCIEPTLISPSKQRMVALIQEDLTRDHIQKVLLIIFLTATIGFLGRELWSLYQRYKQRRGGSLMSELKKIFIKSRICSVCKVNLSCMLTKSCMHMNVCQQCWAIKKQVCNQCNGKVDEALQIYVC